MNPPNVTRPPATKCHNCGAVAAELVCHICKTPRPVFSREPIAQPIPTPRSPAHE